MVELVNMLLYPIMNLKGTQYGSKLMTSTSVLVQAMLTGKIKVLRAVEVLQNA